MTIMKLRAMFVLTMGLFTAALSLSVARAQETPKSIWEGAFTAEQAERGAAAYKAACSECHGGELSGDGVAPPLAGAGCQGHWNDQPVGDLFERIRVSMPPSSPGSVAPAQKADIVAHIFNLNKYPAGKTEIVPKTEALKGIKIELKK